MKLVTAALATVILVAQHSCNAFTLHHLRAASPSFTAVPPLFAAQPPDVPGKTETGKPCDIPNNIEVTSLVNQPNAGRKIRNSVVTDINGDLIPLDRPMGKGTSVVVFLRHLG